MLIGGGIGVNRTATVGDRHGVLGGRFRPEYVADFDDEYYRANSAATTFSDALTHSASSNATMVDSDGLLKWRPHNLALNSASPATQSITVVSGADYTVECTGVSIALSGAGTGTVTEGSPVTITASTTTLTLTVTGSTGTMWAYRSDLGGMVNNPDRGDSYVPTTSTARYLPRRGHYIYNGTSWVNEGALVEPTAGTNKITQSNNLATSWYIDSLTYAQNANGPLGAGTAYTITVTAGASSHWWFIPTGAATGDQASSSFAKAGTAGFLCISSAGPATDGVWFDLSSGTVGTENGSSYGLMEDFGGGWYRCTAIIPGATFQAAHACVSDGQLQNFSAAGTETIFWCGAQVETGSTPSSYIPTSGATVTRAAETLTIPSAKLPWPTPNVIGPELVTNGTFDTDVSGWTAFVAATLTVDTQRIKVTAGGTYGLAVQAISTEIGKVYRLQFSATNNNAVAMYVFVGTGLNLNSENYDSGPLPNGDQSVSFTATATTTWVKLLVQGDTRSAFFDNISVREIDPLAVSIQMQGRATGDTYTTTRWYADANNYITQEINTSDFTFEQAASGTVDAVTGGSFTSGTNVPFNVASRHGSTFINGAVDGTALTADTTPTALPNLSATDMNLAYAGGPMVLKSVRIWAADITDAGLEAATV